MVDASDLHIPDIFRFETKNKNLESRCFEVYGEEVRSKIKGCISSILIFVLLAVMVGNYLFFHIDNNKEVNKTSSTISQLKGVDDCPDSQSENDPCIYGFCHLGHCAKVVLTSEVFEALEINLTSPYNSKIQRAHDRDLDGPILPPRIV